MSLLLESEPSGQPELKISQLGEKLLLERLRPYCSDRLGDDCALMGATFPNQQMVITTDMLIDGVHFSDRTTSAEDAGWRAAAANLSDLAAMGATAWGLVIAVGLPSNTPVSWIEGVYRGFSACLAKYGQPAELVGGDLVRSSVKTLSVTAFGQVSSDRVIKRNTAKIGDSILISGSHGLSKAGLELLLQPQLLTKLNHFSPDSFYQAHQRPIPRLDIPLLINSLIPDTNVSGMDSSDGLYDAINQITQASNVGAKIDLESIPIADHLALLAEDRLWDWILFGGEDFELVLTLQPEAAQKLCNALPAAAIIGQIVSYESSNDSNNNLLSDRISGLPMRLREQIINQAGFQHF